MVTIERIRGQGRRLGEERRGGCRRCGYDSGNLASRFSASVTCIDSKNFDSIYMCKDNFRIICIALLCIVNTFM